MGEHSLSAFEDENEDSKLDSMIARIQELSGGKGGTAERPKQQPPPRPVSRSGPAAAPSAPASRPAPSAPASRANRPPQPQPQPQSQPQSQSKPKPQPRRSNQPSRRPSEPLREMQTLPTTDLPTAEGFTPCRDETWRPVEPHDVASAGLNETLLEAIIYRFLHNIGEAEGRRIADQVKLPFRMIEPILARLKMEQNVGYKDSTATNDYVYVLTESGRNIARRCVQDCTYYGACPVTLSQYIASVKAQSIAGQYPKREDLTRAFNDLLINPDMLMKLGPAIASGRGMFLYGFPGNGKTSIAERVTGAFGKYVWIPRSIDIDGDVLRLFDPMSHQLAMPEAEAGLLDVASYDKRWVRILRPTIVAGGELTMDMLEVQGSAVTKISESPLQLKSNCGTLVIDDFGRQKMAVDALLNRWIVPLEKRFDYLNMPSGKKIQVPFDQLVVFSTNLEPRDLVDEAFLRRIPYKIEAEDPPEHDFIELFQIMCKVLDVPFNASAIQYLIENHYKSANRRMRMCHPRDLLMQVKNHCMYNDLAVQLKPEYLDFAVSNYFSVM
jgi:hypothetical protein